MKVPPCRSSALPLPGIESGLRLPVRRQALDPALHVLRPRRHRRFGESRLAKWETVPAPSVNWDMLCQPGKGRGHMVRIHDIDRDGTFELFYRKPGALVRTP